MNWFRYTPGKTPLEPTALYLFAEPGEPGGMIGHAKRPADRACMAVPLADVLATMPGRGE